ncbi:T9SS type A sorting domain-containing protein [candidate division KSB1 bacterium]|nr:T9SS type A sorting domain-containing protein [candidate division KSB1 bacterium]
MNMRKTLGTLVTMLLLMSLNLAVADTISWDFEDGNDHGFTLHCVLPAEPAPDDPDIAGDESITGVVDPSGEVGLPTEGVAWTIGPPDQFDEQFPAVIEGCHVVDDLLQYGPCNDPFGAAEGDPPYDFTNGRGQSSYLNTYNLNQWGDVLHLATNDQIATSPTVLLGEGAELTVWAVGNTTASWAGTRIAPEFDMAIEDGYVDGSGGIAILSATGDELLASLLIAAEGVDSTKSPKAFTLDLSEFAGMEVIVEVVDAFEGGWGWLAIDEIQITNTTDPNSTVETKSTLVNKFHLAQNYPNPFNPCTNIEFQILQEGHVTLSVFNTLGQPVATLLDQEVKSGTHHVTFNAANFPAGIYYYRVQANSDSQVKKMMLLK